MLKKSIKIIDHNLPPSLVVTSFSGKCRKRVVIKKKQLKIN